jgi:hypothetical protein
METPAPLPLSIRARGLVPRPLNEYRGRRLEYDADTLQILDQLLLAPASQENRPTHVDIQTIRWVDPVRWVRLGCLEGSDGEGRKGQLKRITSRSWAVWTVQGWHPAALGTLENQARQFVAPPSGPTSDRPKHTVGGYPLQEAAYCLPGALLGRAEGEALLLLQVRRRSPSELGGVAKDQGDGPHRHWT